MKQSFTQNLLVKYIYNETSVAEKLHVEELLNDNYSLYEEYEALFDAYSALPKAKFSPSPDTISNILSYSKRANALVLS